MRRRRQRHRSGPHTRIFFELAHPSGYSLLLFAGGFRSDKYATLQQGIQIEQTLTPYVSLAARISGYQLFEGEGFANPLDPGRNGHRARLNFVRLQGGVDINPYPGTHLYLFGGRDIADSNAAVVEGDFSSWLFRYSSHPINFSFEAGYDSENHVTSSAIDLRTVVFSRGKYMVTAGGGGTVYGGGFISGLEGEGGPDLGLYLNQFLAGIDLQGGYGSAGAYGQVSIYKAFLGREE